MFDIFAILVRDPLIISYEILFLKFSSRVISLSAKVNKIRS